jgi:hypothetical protein
MKTSRAPEFFTLAFGLFLGLCLWKFGNPVILDPMISVPVTAAEYFNVPWPPHWAGWLLLPLVILGAGLALQNKIPRPQFSWLGLLPLAWLGWQFLAAGPTVDADLTAATLWQFSGVVACYFLGRLVFARDALWRWLLPGLLAVFAFSLVRGVDQRLFEFPQDGQLLAEGERCGWTNFPPETVAQMKADNLILTTNGADVANPVILAKFKNARVYGTLVYPNALAGIILLLGPVALALAFGATKKLKPPIRLAAIALTLFLDRLETRLAARPRRGRTVFAAIERIVEIQTRGGGDGFDSWSRRFHHPVSALLRHRRPQHRRAAGLLACRGADHGRASAVRHRAGHVPAALRTDQVA